MMPLIEVTETITVRAEGKQIRRGIYRDFPVEYEDRLGNSYKIKLEPLSVLRNGRPESSHTVRSGRDVAVELVDVSQLEVGVPSEAAHREPPHAAEAVDADANRHCPESGRAPVSAAPPAGESEVNDRSQ